MSEPRAAAPISAPGAGAITNPDRGLVLVGLPGSGKTTVARLLAARRAVPFVDTDELISARTGMPAAAYLGAHGEADFRDVERAAIREACGVPGAVVATGGGALDDPLNRWLLWSHGRIAWLSAPDATLLSRLAADPTPRPLLAVEPERRLAELAARREPQYRAADVTVDARAGASEVADAVEDALRGLPAREKTGRRLFDARTPRHHPIGPETARVVLGSDLDGALAEVLAEVGGTPAAVADPRAPAAPGAGIGRRREIRGGERIKRTAALQRILAWLADAGAERTDPLVAIGGGTVTDLAGLAAALYARGMPLVAVPTTWLGQVDAALGGKVAIDLPAAKNMVGAFWPAWAVVADTSALRTLPPARLRDGMAEALKTAIIGDPLLWRLIDERGVPALRHDEAARYAITERAVRVKLDVVARDPFEHGPRRRLNLGHTVGHALEVVSGYRLPHGAAVALGLRAEAHLGLARGGDTELAASLDDLLHRLGYRLHRSFDVDDVRAAMGHDKKRVAGRLRWQLPLRVGEVVEVDDLTDAEVTAALRRISEA